jgi:hypothetical protein
VLGRRSLSLLGKMLLDMTPFAEQAAFERFRFPNSFAAYKKMRERRCLAFLVDVMELQAGCAAADDAAAA